MNVHTDYLFFSTTQRQKVIRIIEAITAGTPDLGPWAMGE